MCLIFIGLLFSIGVFLSVLIIFIFLVIWLKIICFLLRCLVGIVVMKNWELFVFGLVFVIDSKLGLLCCKEFINMLLFSKDIIMFILNKLL